MYKLLHYSENNILNITLNNNITTKTTVMNTHTTYSAPKNTNTNGSIAANDTTNTVNNNSSNTISNDEQSYTDNTQDDELFYELERIIKCKPVLHDGVQQMMYYVKWKGYKELVSYTTIVFIYTYKLNNQYC